MIGAARVRWTALCSCAAACAVAGALAAPGAAADSHTGRAARRADAPARSTGSSHGASRPGAGRRSPDEPPLTATAPSETQGGEGAADSSPELDPLVSNGLASPTCAGATGGGQLSPASARNCETSGFVAAGAPTGDYGIDVHIDTGVAGLGGGWLLSAVQQLFVTPVWMALVWAVHALVVMLEWCFAIDLLDSSSVGLGVARALRHAQATFTEPWLATVLAIAAALAAYNGLIRRRVAETLGQALLMLAMMAGGIWVTIDPAGTVGALGSWADQAGLGTLAVSASGSPARGAQTLADSLGTVFSAAIEVPWCYLEFGDVGWCRNSARLDPRLRTAALSIAAGELVFARCTHEVALFERCPAPRSRHAQTLEHSAQLLRAARSNGAIFLALPANGPQRNSIGDSESLLRAICRSEQATACRGAAAAEAEFRTDRGTWPRVAGLLLIVAGVLGMLLLLGFLAMRLLASALLALLLLMLAPAAVLAPALGDAGRAVFRRWAAQLLGAVVSKLLFSFLLGAVLTVLAILNDLEALGWWTQWLLMLAFWWGAFTHRHQVLQFTAGAAGAAGQRQAEGRRTFARRASEAFEMPRKLVGGVKVARRRREQQHANRALGEGQRQAAQASAAVMRVAQGNATQPKSAGDGAHGRGSAHAQAGLTAEHGAHVQAGLSAQDGAEPVDEQAMRTLLADRRCAREIADGEPEGEGRLTAMRAQLAQLAERRDAAVTEGDTRRAVQLAYRAARVAANAERERGGLEAARRTSAVAATDRADGFSTEQLREREQFLQAQSLLLSSAQRSSDGDLARRDYPALAGLAGYGPREYESLHARAKRAARLQIDRELGARAVAARRPEAQGRTPDGANSRGPISHRGRGAGHEGDASSESSVMADMRAVAERRKRQLGRGRP